LNNWPARSPAASPDILTLEGARTFAQAEFDLAQIRRVKVALISRVTAFVGLGKPDDDFQSLGQVRRLLSGLKRGELILPSRIETPAMPTTDPERTTEAIRRALPELIKLERYERRAAARRARAMTTGKQRGRPFQKGCSGNPQGRPLGARNAATVHK
jgi:hypothetical protein